MNINKIKLSGTTYNIQDENACKVVELTQAEYDALPATAKTSNSLFVITDATAGDLSNYYTKSETSGATQISTALASKADTATTYTKTETDNAITAATSTKQDTLVSGTNIKTINNESILGSGNIDIQGGGGKAIEAGRGITVTTGETADTVSFDLPISAGTGSNSIIAGYSGNTATKSYSIALGSFNKASGDSSMAVNDYNVAGGKWSFAGGSGTKALGEASTSFGYNTNANKNYSFAVGRYNNANNVASFACGVSNISSSASTTFGHSGNTLFSVGNGGQGYYSSNRHNAFEIRENGDIYIADTNDTETTHEYEKPMIKLQDALGGGGASYSAGTGIDITNDVISVTGKVDTTTFNTYSGSVDTALSGKQDTLSAGTGIDITNNVISATGGGGMTEDDELLLSTALTDLNDRKIDASEVKSNYQKKGDYVTTSALNTRLAEYETALDEQNVEEVTAYALNDLNDRFGGLKIVKISETVYAALATKDENTLYIVVADPS